MSVEIDFAIESLQNLSQRYNRRIFGLHGRRDDVLHGSHEVRELVLADIRISKLSTAQVEGLRETATEHFDVIGSRLDSSSWFTQIVIGLLDSSVRHEQSTAEARDDLVRLRVLGHVIDKSRELERDVVK